MNYYSMQTNKQKKEIERKKVTRWEVYKDARRAPIRRNELIISDDLTAIQPRCLSDKSAPMTPRPQSRIFACLDDKRVYFDRCFDDKSV